MKKIYCYECSKEVEGEKKEILNTYLIRGEEVKVLEEVLVCNNCKQELMISEEDISKQMYNTNNEYLKLHNLSFEKIKQLRMNLGLSQSEFANKLGWSKKTIIRYENGQSLPQGEYLNFYERLASDINYFYERTLCFEDNYMNQNIKGINSILYILKDNPLGITSIMKHLFGIDFYSLNNYGKQITNFKYARLPHGPVIDGYKNLIDLLVFNGFIEWDIDDNGNLFYIQKKDFDISLFSKEELECLKYIKNIMHGKTAQELSQWSHNFIGWKETKTGSIINTSYASEIDFDNI